MRLTAGGAACSCGYEAVAGASRRMLAAQHQFAIFLLDAAHGEEVVTNCLFCGDDLPMTAEDGDPMIAYSIWLTQPCASCGKTPRDAVEPAMADEAP